MCKKQGLKESLRHSDDVTGKNHSIFAHLLLASHGLGGALYHDMVALGARRVAASERHRVHHGHAVDVGIAARVLDLAEDEERSIVEHLDIDARIDQVI